MVYIIILEVQTIKSDRQMKIDLRVGEMAQRVRTLIVLPKVLSSKSSHVRRK